MRSFLLLLLLAVPSLALFTPISEELVAEIKMKATTWVPMEVDQNPLARLDSFQLLRLLGSKQVQVDQGRQVVYEGNDDLPESFSALEKWPQCIGKFFYCLSLYSAYTKPAVLWSRLGLCPSRNFVGEDMHFKQCNTTSYALR
jgi:hypothetical protein